MYHIIYETRNKINDKIYVGYHYTNDLNDSYLGSGKLIKISIKKYGKSNFERNILHIFLIKNEALEKELEIVNQEFVNREDTYNLKIGGEGGFDYINQKLKNDPEYKKSFYEKVSKGILKSYKEGKSKGWPCNKYRPSYWKGKSLSEIHKKKISENNAMNLDKDLINNRINEYNEIEKIRGWVNKLANKWNISHTQVNRFIKKYC
jgi:hypothetical protein